MKQASFVLWKKKTLSFSFMTPPKKSENLDPPAPYLQPFKFCLSPSVWKSLISYDTPSPWCFRVLL